MPIARPEPQDARVIAHVDMDCFYVQVEQRKHPELKGSPTAVVQYNSWKGGGLIAVSYEARKYGVKRSMRGDEAKKVCPNIQLVQVPVARGKADLNLYRNAGSEVISILATKGRCERASIDEVYLDLSDAAEQMLLETSPETLETIDEEALRSHVLGFSEASSGQEEYVKQWLCRSDAEHQDKLLACGAIIVAQLRMAVLKETTFTCSAGISHNKMLAKLASGMHKPAQQTVVPSSSVKELLASLPIKKMKQLGGKLGTSLQNDLGVSTVGDLLHFSEENLQEHFGINTGSWLWNIARGICGDEVEGRLLPKSHGCGKTFPGPQALRTINCVEHWLNELCEELSERIQSDLDKNRRAAHTLTLHARAFKVGGLEAAKKFPSKSSPLRYGTAKIQEDARKLFDSGLREFLGLQKTEWGVTSLSISASKIFAVPSGTSSILKFFNRSCPLPTLSEEAAQLSAKDSLSKEAADVSIEDSLSFSTSGSGDDFHSTRHVEIIGSSEENDHPHFSQTVKRSESGNWSEPTECQQVCFTQDDNGTPHPSHTTWRSDTLKTNQRNRGSYSIMNFFPGSSSSCSSSNICHGAERYSDANGMGSVKRLRYEADNYQGSRNQVQLRDTWRFTVEDVDPSVIDELPLEIQQEVREWLNSSRTANAVKQGSTIDHYFSPVKGS